jgi:hypothetical protein
MPDETKANETEKAKVKSKSAPETDITSVEFMMISLIAMGKDAIDVGGTIILIGIPFTPILNIGAIATLWLWCIMRLKKFPTARFVASSGIEFIPLFNGLPMWTAFMISLYLQQKGYLPKFLKNIPGFKNGGK